MTERTALSFGSVISLREVNYLSPLNADNTRAHQVIVQQLEAGVSTPPEVRAMQVGRQLDPGALKAPGFNFLNVHPIQAIAFEHYQPACTLWLRNRL